MKANLEKALLENRLSKDGVEKVMKKVLILSIGRLQSRRGSRCSDSTVYR